MFPVRFLLRQKVNFPLKQLSCGISSENLINVNVNDQNGFAVVEMNRPPVNSLNLEFLKAFCATLDDLEKNKSKGMILTSSSNKIFCAGLDITEMHKPDEKRARDFWRSFQDAWLKLYNSSFPTAAAINGHSPAGGCVLAVACEYRVMCPDFTIGMNESQLGIVAPPWLMPPFVNTIGVREAEKALTEGTLYPTDAALKIKLIDEIATDKTDAIAKCEKFLSKFKKIPKIPRGLTKQQFRVKEVKALATRQDEDVEYFISFIKNPEVQKSLGLYIEGLKKK